MANLSEATRRDVSSVGCRQQRDLMPLKAADDVVVRHVKAAAGEFAYGVLGILVALEHGDHGVLLRGVVFPFLFLH